MKYINKEESKNGGIRYHFFIGREEIILLEDLIRQFRIKIPRCVETTTVISRLRNMEKILAKIIIEEIKKYEN
jgi:hypothetical protein